MLKKLQLLCVVLMLAEVCWSQGTATNSNNGNATALQNTPIDTAGPANAQCLVFNSGTGKWAPGSCAGSAGTLNGLLSPTGNAAFTMGAFKITFTFNAATGTSDLHTITDTLNNTGTGHLLLVNTASGSTAKPIGFFAQGTTNGVEMNTAGVLAPAGAGGITANAFSGILAAVNGGTAVSDFSFSGNTHKAASLSGSTATNNCAKWDASGNIVDAGAACNAAGLADPGSNGLVVRTSNNVTTARSIATADSTHVTVSNGTGVAGNPTLDTGSNVPLLNAANTFAANPQTFNQTANGNTVLTGKRAIDTSSTGNFMDFTSLDGLTHLWEVDVTGSLLAGIIPGARVSGNIAGNAAGFTGSLSGDVTGAQSATVVAKVNGTTVPTNSAADQTIVTTASQVAAWKALQDCSTATSAVSYSTSTHSFGCNTIATSGVVNNGVQNFFAYYPGNGITVDDHPSVQTDANNTLINAPVWNNIATVFTALKVNPTDTNSAAGSLLMDLQDSNTSKVNVDKTGKVTVSGPGAGEVDLTEGSAVTGVAGQDTLAADSGTHALMSSYNGDTASRLARYSDNLGVFASTSSAQLAAVLNDEIGSGKVVFATSFSGNSGVVAEVSGALTSGNCIKSDASGNMIDAGAPCGSGGGGSANGADKAVQVAYGGAFYGDATSFSFDRVIKEVDVEGTGDDVDPDVGSYFMLDTSANRSNNCLNGSTSCVGFQAPTTVTNKYAFELPDSGFAAGLLYAGAIASAKSTVSVKPMLQGSSTLTYTSIAAQTAQDQTLSVTGASVTNFGVFCSPRASLGNANLSWSAWASGADTISVRVTNPTTGAVTPSAVAWGCTIFQ